VTGGDAGPDAGPTCPLCSSINHGPTVYASGSTALANFVARVGKALAGEGTATVIYQATGSCAGVHSVIDQTPLNSAALAVAAYYDPTDSTNPPKANNCLLDQGTSIIGDVGLSDVFYTTCYNWSGGITQLPASVKENFAPIQTMTLVVAQSSKETAISLDAAHDVFAFGNNSMLAPWNDQTVIEIRSPASGTQNMIAAWINVDPAAWVGVNHGKSGDVLKDIVAASAMPNGGSAIGILGADFSQENLTQLRVLAIQDKGQACGYLPDLTQGSNEKANVRDGHYPIWGPAHLYVNTNNAAHQQAITTFVDSMNGVRQLSGYDLLTLYAQSHIVPNCAMHVQRQSDGADYRPYHPVHSCSCYFDNATGAQTGCKPCSQDSDCATGQECGKLGAGQKFCETIGMDP
jgi:ABC-type phosphate transport system substrate-binding protein